MARGSTRKPIPLLVNGAIDTKTNPKLVQAPALLELENMYQLRTGELVCRNGFTLLPAIERALLGAPSNMFVTQNGGLGTISQGGGHASDTNTRALRYGNAISGREGWAADLEGPVATTSPVNSFPNVTAMLSGLPSGNNLGGVISVVDPDIMIVGGAQHVAWTNGVDAKLFGDLRDINDGRQLFTNAALTPTIAAVRPPLVASTGSNWAALFYSSAANHLDAIAHNPVSQTNTSLALATDLAASPWFDVKAIPNTSKFAVAYKANAGGIKCGIYDPAASTFTSVVATGAADASFCLGWLDDPFATGKMYLATIGSGAGLVVREMGSGSMVVSATRTLDAAATANVRNVTGHLWDAAGKYLVMWDVAGTTTIADGMKMAYWDGGAAFSFDYVAGPYTLYSRSVKFPDGKYRVLGCFISLSGQSMYTLLLCDTLGSSIPLGSPVGAQCHLMQGEAAARRSQCSLTTPVSNGTNIVMAVARSRSLTLPDGSKSAPNTSASIATFQIASKVTHAREVGGTVFVPGGLLYRDDGATFEPATFPIAPEAATGASSAAGGAMTAGGAYSYRIVFRGLDAAGRTYWSAGSVPFSITLGGADNRVTLAVWGLSLVRGLATSGLSGFGQVMAEVYRRGPAATGATLYNKVGEVNAVTTPGTPTVTFIDTMSDANAALGQVAYFNGNVLENFNPPAHTLLEVNGNRVGVVNAEDPTEFWFSKEYKAGTGIGFNPLLKVAISGDGAGGITALAAKDGRWYLFKKTAIYVLSGDGPNDLGQGSFNAPQAITRSIGCANPSSVLETPDGIMFQAQTGGFWVIGGDGLQYIGAPVEAYALAESVVGAALAPALPTARFLMASGRMLEWDYFHKRWYTHQLKLDANNLADCVNSPLLGFCIMDVAGNVIREISGQLVDIKNGQLAIVPRISFPHLQLAGVAGYQRLHAITFSVDAVGNCTLSADAEYNLSGALTGTPHTIALAAGTSGVQVEYNPPEGLAKCTAVRPVLTATTVLSGGTIKVTGATALVTVKRGSKVPAESRMT